MKKNRLPKNIRQKNRAFFWLLWGVVALFFILALIRMGNQ